MECHPYPAWQMSEVMIYEGWWCVASPPWLSTPERWETSFLRMFVNVADVFGGYAFGILLSRRIFDVNTLLSSS